MLLGYMLQTAMRKVDTNMTIHILEKFLEIGHQPDSRLLKKLCNVETMDDDLYVLLHKNFPHYGLLNRKQRHFEKPKVGFNAKGHGIVFPNFRKVSLKKRPGRKEYSKRDRKGFRIL